MTDPCLLAIRREQALKQVVKAFKVDTVDTAIPSPVTRQSTWKPNLHGSLFSRIASSRH
jgi:hypothetical protein